MGGKYQNGVRYNRLVRTSLVSPPNSPVYFNVADFLKQLILLELCRLANIFSVRQIRASNLESI
jgi:hypothetical protein